MATCFIGIGSNLGDREKNIKVAIDKLRKTKGVNIAKISRFYQTRPEDFIDQGDFLNGVIRLSTDLAPYRLLQKLKQVESSLGRKETIRFGPRVIDLDILLYDNQRIKTKDLVIPHLRMYDRDFVLKPLREIAPEMFKLKVISSVSRMRSFVAAARDKNKTVGFVPTMGYLHEGHLSLLRQAKQDSDKVIVSIFVNPAQFGPKDDFRRYPRDFKRDESILRAMGVDVVFYPGIEAIYPKEYLTYVNVEKITSGLCGVSRPGHFRGVTTIVTKLFNIVNPDIAYFGQKDFQQAKVIQRMVRDLNMPVKIKVMPIVREEDGLATSSRNTYLNKFQRSDAVVLYYSLMDTKALIKEGERNTRTIIKFIRDKIRQIKSARIDYIQIVDAKSLEKIDRISGKVLIALAVWFGRTRLIDNIVVRVN